MRRAGTSAVLLAVSAVLIAVGAHLSQNADVWSKAVRVCLECVGIG